jgi:hypothetical protein
MATSTAAMMGSCWADCLAAHQAQPKADSQGHSKAVLTEERRVESKDGLMVAQTAALTADPLGHNWVLTTADSTASHRVAHWGVTRAVSMVNGCNGG